MTDTRAPKKLFVLYDERARSGHTDEAIVLCCADSLKEAKRHRREMFPGAVIVSYDVTSPGNELVNEEMCG